MTLTNVNLLKSESVLKLLIIRYINYFTHVLTIVLKDDFLGIKKKKKWSNL